MIALGLRPRAFICFSVFGTRDEALALVFDILHENPLHHASVVRRKTNTNRLLLGRGGSVLSKTSEQLNRREEHFNSLLNGIPVVVTVTKEMTLTSTLALSPGHYLKTLFEDIVSNEHHKLANLLPQMSSSYARRLRNKRRFNTPVCRTDRFINSFIISHAM